MRLITQLIDAVFNNTCGHNDMQMIVNIIYKYICIDMQRRRKINKTDIYVVVNNVALIKLLYFVYLPGRSTITTGCFIYLILTRLLW